MPRGLRSSRVRKSSATRGGGGAGSRARAHSAHSQAPSQSQSHSEPAARALLDFDVSTPPPRGDGEQKSLLDDEKSSESGFDATQFFSNLRLVAETVYLVRAYKSKAALKVLQKLEKASVRQTQSGLVLEFTGRAHFELASFKKACEYFELLQKRAPHHFNGLESYSTCLWYSKEEVKLSYLAQTMMDKDRLWFGTWVILGNCFSLQKDHAAAIKYFKRALQLYPEYPYAFTLCAHEYIASEDYDKAVEGFRCAIRLDPRHYNAWYGLGTIHFRQENYDLALHHFKRASKVNPESSIICCYIGMTLASKNEHDLSLAWLQQAVKLKPTNNLAQYELASTYIALNRTQEGIAVLTALAETSPKEASVHYMLGKAHHALGHTQLAMRCLARCLDLNPKDKNLVKAAIDAVGHDEPADDASDAQHA